MTLVRRTFLALPALLVFPWRALGFGDTTRVDIGELNLGQAGASRARGWKRLLYEVKQTTSVECEPRVQSVRPVAEELFSHPFVVLQGSDAFALPSESELEQLARFLSYGGFLFIDDTSGRRTSAFDASVRQLCEALFPTRPLAPLPSDHSLYRTFFLLGRPAGRLATFDALEGVTVGNLTPLVYSRNDVSGALLRKENGRHDFACVPGGEGQRREAIKLGINLVVYALTANYKRDMTHVRQLLLEGRLK